MDNRVAAVIVAAGSGRRMGTDIPKQLLPYGESTVLGTTVSRFAESGLVDEIIIVSPEDGSLDGEYMRIADAVRLGVPGYEGAIRITRGGAERGDSVRSGLSAAAESASGLGMSTEDVIVLIHDAARPGVDADIIRSSIEALESARAAVAAIPSTDSVRVIDDGPGQKLCSNSDFPLKPLLTYPIMNSNVIERWKVYNVQTPQTFRLSDIQRAYEIAGMEGYRGTDDASVAEHAGIKAAIIPGSISNKKITYIEDISMTTRVGTGYDVHKLVPDRALILCGTPVPYEKGLLGHSDADVAAHALMDALLGAAGLGDIGRHFPDNDDTYKDADSMVLLARVRDMLKEAGTSAINNVDVTIIAQAPRLSPYNDQMKHNIADTLGIPESSVNIKATTEEGLGFTGRGEGIAAIATCAIEGRFIQ